jgi:hypothetical protein
MPRGRSARSDSIQRRHLGAGTASVVRALRSRRRELSPVPKVVIYRDYLRRVALSLVSNKLGDHSGSCGLHAGDHMRVLLQCEGRRLVPESLADYLYGHSGLERQRCVRVPSIVQPNGPEAGSPDEPRKRLTEPMRVNRAPFSLATTRSWSHRQLQLA